MTSSTAFSVRTSLVALLLAGLMLVPALPARAATPSTPVAAPELAAVEFISSVNSFAGRLGDDLLVYASSVFFKDAAGYARAVEIKPATLRQVYAMKIGWVARRGLRYILHPDGPVADGLPPVLIVFLVDGIFKLDLDGSYRYRQPPAPDPNPQNQFPSLADALVGVTGEGALTAVFHFGPDADIRCRLLAGDAPLTVASFVALARGLRAVRTERKTPGTDVVEVQWTKRPWYDGSQGAPVFGRRVLRLEGAEAPGFFIEDEFSVTRRHDRPALLTTIPSSPDMWEGAIAITTTPVSELDDVGTVFGVCDEAAVEKLSRIWSVRKGEPFIPPLVNIGIVRE